MMYCFSPRPFEGPFLQGRLSFPRLSFRCKGENSNSWLKIAGRGLRFGLGGLQLGHGQIRNVYILLGRKT